MIIGSALLFLLVVTRMAGLVRQEERVVSRERALRGAGIDLVAAAGHEQVYAAAISGVERLLGDGVVRPARAPATTAAAVGRRVVRRSAAGILSPRRRTGFALERSGVVRLAHAALPTRWPAELRLAQGEAVAILPLSVRDGPARPARRLARPAVSRRARRLARRRSPPGRARARRRVAGSRISTAGRARRASARSSRTRAT